MIVELKTMKDFLNIKNGAKGYVLITDTATGDAIHNVLCDHVISSNFYEKVISNKSRNGRYFWSETSAALRQKFPKTKSCAVCRG